MKLKHLREIPLVCERCGKQIFTEFTIAECIAVVWILHDKVLHAIEVCKFFCPECNVKWTNVVNVFFGVNIEEELDRKLTEEEKEHDDEKKKEKIGD